MTQLSYDPAAVLTGGFDDELARLTRQAEFSAPAELDRLVAIGVPVGPAVEIGCGPGDFLTRMAISVPSAACSGLEPDPRLRTVAQARGLDVVDGVAETLPYRDGQLSCLVYRFVLQHLADPVTALREARRVLRPGGRVFLIDVDDRLWGHVEPFDVRAAGAYARYAAAQHERAGDRTIGLRLSRLLRAAGFTTVGTDIYSVTTDDRPIADFEPHLGPARIAGAVRAGQLSLADLAAAVTAWRAVVKDPNAYAMVLGHLAWAQA